MYLPLQTIWIPATEASGCRLPPANYSAGPTTGLPLPGWCEGRQLCDTFTSSSPKMTRSRPSPFHSHCLLPTGMQGETREESCALPERWSVSAPPASRPGSCARLVAEGTPGPSRCKKTQGKVLWQGKGIFISTRDRSRGPFRESKAWSFHRKAGDWWAARLPGCTRFPGALAVKQ